MKPGGGKEWHTAAELAELALPGMPRTKRKMNERAGAECWALRQDDAGRPLARRREARGGGVEYHIDVLPPAARAALVARGVAAIAHVADAPETSATGRWRWYEAQTDKTKAEAHRRAQIVAMVESYERVGLTRSAAVVNAAARHEIAPSTVWRWIADIDGIAPADRLPFLAPRRDRGGKTAEIDAQAWNIFLSDYLRPEKPTLAECYRRTEKWAAANGVTLPHRKTFARRIERDVDPMLVTAKRNGAEALRRTLPAQERTVMDLHAMEAVNIDGHKFDVFVEWEDGTIARPMMVAIQDLYSRKMLAWRVARSENSVDTRLAIADLLRNWGIPAHFVLDNGRAFASKWITGGAPNRFRFKVKDDEPLGVLTALGIAIHWATPFRGQSKPIERAFRDLTDIIARHPITAGAYTGNKPDAKPENYGQKAVPIAQFRALVDRGIAAHNARPGRRTETAHGRSFDDAFAESYAAAPVGRASEDQLRLALLTAEQCRCDRRNAEVRLEGNRYWAPELADHMGKPVTIRFDPDNLHSAVHVYTRTGEFVCTAPVLSPEGFFDKAGAQKRRKQEQELRRRVRDAAELEQLLDARTVAALLSEDQPLPETVPSKVARPVRHRGQTAAALKIASDTDAPAPVPTKSVVDRLGHLRLV
ncbi:MAG: transposase domain-containing protein [Pseudomonadota bacterium]